MKIAVVLACVVASTRGHGILTFPRSRNFLASHNGGNTKWPWESCPQCLNNGGMGVVQANQEVLMGTSRWPTYPEEPAMAARHAVCGDFKYDDDGDFAPLSSSYSGGMNQGKWGSDSPFVQGTAISLDVEIWAHHQGHFEFYVCNKADQAPGANTDAACLNEHRLQRAPDVDGEVSPTDPSHPERYYLPPKCALSSNGPGGDGKHFVENMRYMLPADLSCEHCVLQWVYVGANSCNPDDYRDYFHPDNNGPDASEACTRDQWWSDTIVDCSESSYPEEFWNCADIRIEGGGGASPMPPISTLPPASPTDQPAAATDPPSTPAPPSPVNAPTQAPPILDPPTNSQCQGEPCEHEMLCRSEWGYCGDGDMWCNAKSTWLPSCAVSVPQPTPQPSPPTAAPQPTPQPSSTPPPSAPLSPTAGPPSSPSPLPSSPTLPPSDFTPATLPPSHSAPAPDGELMNRQHLGTMMKSTFADIGISRNFADGILLYETPQLQWIPSDVYMFNDMVVALEKMWSTGIGELQLYLGDDVATNPAQARKYAMVNIAAFLAQSMQETIRYNACDENSWDRINGRYPVSNSCGQLGQSYQDYQCSAAEAHMACEVDPDMQLVATTNAKWYGAPGPLSCGPRSVEPFTGFWDHTKECNKPWANPPELCEDYDDQIAGGVDNSQPFGVANSDGRTDTEGCCFWGRGVIQTTGVCNFGKLNYYLGARAESEGRDALFPNVNFCKRPDLICDPASGHPELKWIAGLFYWMESVQRYDEGGWNYLENLRDFVDGGMPAVGSDSGFIHAVSGIVNRGCHNPPCGTGHMHAGSERAQNFKNVLHAMKLM